jgi:hypothetical protein
VRGATSIRILGRLVWQPVTMPVGVQPVTMPDDLYDRDILTWSEHQSFLLRRVARGERVNVVDWPHLVEQIEDVGISQLNAVP